MGVNVEDDIQSAFAQLCCESSEEAANCKTTKKKSPLGANSNIHKKVKSKILIIFKDTFITWSQFWLAFYCSFNESF